MKSYIGICILVMTFLFVFSAWATNISPDRLVDETVKDVVYIINQDEELKTGRNKEKMLDLVRNKILPHFDFLRMTQLAMGKNWRNANAEQQSVLVEEFRTLLVRTYSNTLSTYSDEIINVSPSGVLGDATETTVKTQIVQKMGKEPVPIDYSMAKTATGWKVYDVTVAGVSLVTNYRSSFNSQIRRGGVDGLIKTLTKKNISLVGK